MHTDGTDSSGFMRWTPNSAAAIQAYYYNVLKEASEIPDAIANIRAVSKYDGEHTLPGAPISASSLKISDTLTSSLPMRVSEAQVTQSLETSDNGLEWQSAE